MSQQPVQSPPRYNYPHQALGIRRSPEELNSSWDRFRNLIIIDPRINLCTALFVICKSCRASSTAAMFAICHA